MFFEKKVDRRSRKAMVEFLTSHFRYDTMNSWNRMTSYAHSVKMNRLGLTKAQEDAAYEMLGADENFWDHLQWVIKGGLRHPSSDALAGDRPRQRTAEDARCVFEGSEVRSA